MATEGEDGPETEALEPMEGAAAPEGGEGEEARRMDPLVLLRNAARKGEKVPFVADYLLMEGYKIHRNTRCAYRRSPDEPFLDIGSVWYMYHEISKEDGSYTESYTKKRGFKFIGVGDRIDLLAYLEGTTDICPNIVEDVLQGRLRPITERQGTTPAPPRKKARIEPRKSSNEPKELSYTDYAQSVRSLQDFEHIVRVPGKDLPGILPLLKLAQNEIATWYEDPRTIPPKATRAQRPFIHELLDALERNGKDKPIILVPMSKNAPVNLENVDQLLQDGLYQRTEKGGASGFGRFESMRKDFVEVVRTIDGQRWTFQVRDSTKAFTKGHWKRVVAVVTDGADWQFKGWPFATTIDLFTTAKGLFFKDKSLSIELPQHVKQWPVTILDLPNPQLQHRAQALRDAFWREVEDFMKSERKAMFSNTATLDTQRVEITMSKPIL